MFLISLFLSVLEVLIIFMCNFLTNIKVFKDLFDVLFVLRYNSRIKLEVSSNMRKNGAYSVYGIHGDLRLAIKTLGRIFGQFLNFVYNKSSNIVLFCRSYAELSANGNWMFCVWLSGKFHRAETRLERKFCPLFYTSILGAL